MTAVSAGHLEATRPLVERQIGRPLRRNEQVVDVFRLTAALDAAKAALHAAIEREKARAVRDAIRTGHPLTMDVTTAMLAPLEQLFNIGAAEAYAELVRAGYNPSRGYTDADAEPQNPLLAEQATRLKSGLNGLSVKLQMEQDAIRVQLEARNRGSVAEALATALLKVPGGLSIAAGLVSKTMFTGMAATFDDNPGLVDQWEYTSVLDGGTCDVCEPLDGTVYDSLDELYTVLPDFGPNPDCLGGDRCRCRAVPASL